MESQSFPRGSRRRYSAAFKSRLVALACEPGASVAELSRTHQISPSLLTRWLHAAAYPASRRKALSAETALQPSTPTAFVPVELDEKRITHLEPNNAYARKRLLG